MLRVKLILAIGVALAVALSSGATPVPAQAQAEHVAQASKLKKLRTVVPKVSGRTSVGSTLTAKAGSWKPRPVKLKYQWLRNGKSIPKATKSTYRLVPSDAGTKVSVKVTGSKKGYAAKSRKSASIAIERQFSAPAPQINGDHQVGSVLTAVTGTWNPVPSTLKFQWLRDGSAIADARGNSYKIAPADEGRQLAVRVTGTRSGYTILSRTSTSLSVSHGNVLGGVPTIEGTPTIGETVAVSKGDWSPLPLVFTYQWLRDGANIAGETGTEYTITGADAATEISVRVTGSKQGYSSTSRESGKLLVLGKLTAATPSVTGEATLGSELVAVPGVWGPGSVVLSYQWLRNGDPISGATADRYDVQAEDAGAELSVRVTGTRSKYKSESRTSAALVAALAFSTSPTPTISGTAKLGQTLQAGTSGWSPVPHRFAYQWLRDGAQISGAEADSYTLTQADLGASIRVEVTALRDGYMPTTRRSSSITPPIPGGVRIVAGKILEDITWSPDDADVYVLDGIVEIASGVTLTIEAGTVVKAKPSSSLNVSGSLVVNGTQASPVVFTSYLDDSVGGDTNNDGDASTPQTSAWRGDYVSGSVTATWLNMKYAGVFSSSGKFDVANTVIDGDVSWTAAQDGDQFMLRNSTVNGHVAAEVPNNSSAKILIEGNSLHPGSDDHGVRVVSGSTRASSSVLVRNNTVTGGSRPFSVTDAKLTPSNLTGNTASGSKERAFFISGALTEDWSVPTSGLPYVIGGPSSWAAYEYGLKVSEGLTMTVAAGTVLKFYTSSYYPANLFVSGSLVVNGTQASPVVFTSYLDDSVGGDTNSDGDATVPMAGDWGGINAEGTVTARFLNARYGGGVGSSGTLDIRDSTIPAVDWNPVADGKDLVLRSNVISGGGYRDVALFVDRGNLTGVIDVQGNVLKPRVTDSGLQVRSLSVRAAASLVLKDNVVHGGTRPFRVMDMKLTPSNLTGNTATGVTENAFFVSGTLTEDWTLPAGGLTYVVTEDYSDKVDGLTVPAGITFNVPAGRVLKFWALSSWQREAQLSVLGSLVVSGTQASPVVFTSYRDDSAGGDTNSDGDATVPMAGDWGGINAGTGGSIALDHAEVRYASTAVDVSGGAEAQVDGRFSNNSVDIRSDGTFVDARNIDWGSPDGPSDTQVSGSGVLTFPWVGFAPPETLSETTPTQDIPNDNATTCAQYDYVAFGLRGSDESPQGDYDSATKTWSLPAFRPGDDGFGGYNGQVTSALKSLSGKRIKRVPVQYQALPVPVVDNRVSLNQYLNSIYDGVSKFKTLVAQELQDCPNAKIVAVGYSQGALAAHLALREIAAQHPSYLSSIAGTAFIADPGRVSAGQEDLWQSVSFDEATGIFSPVPAANDLRATNGIWALANLPLGGLVDNGRLPGPIEQRTVTLCHDRDLVCATRLKGRFGPHTAYDSNELAILAHRLSEKITS